MMFFEYIIYSVELGEQLRKGTIEASDEAAAKAKVLSITNGTSDAVREREADGRVKIYLRQFSEV